MLTAYTGFTQDIELKNDTNEDFWVRVYIWTDPPCPGNAYNSDWWVCVPMNSMVPITAPPEKFLKQTKIQCGCGGGDDVGSTPVSYTHLLRLCRPAP